MVAEFWVKAALANHTLQPICSAGASQTAERDR